MPLDPKDDGIVNAINETTKQKFVLFYGETPVFSNYFPSNFVDENGIAFNCVEQYFHYKKAEHFGDAQNMRSILASSSPDEQKKLGKTVKKSQEEWLRVGFRYMKDGLRFKFEQNASMRNEILQTKGKILVEASPTDIKWGVGMSINNPDAVFPEKWKGQNLLGKCLMEIRDEIEMM